MRGLGAIVAFATVSVVAHGIRVYEGTNLGPNNATVPQRREDNFGYLQNSQLLKYSKELKPTPDLYKVKLTQQGYLQFLRYLTDVPPLREYTFCLWLSSNNLSHPQPIFSYAVQDRSKVLSFWYEPKDATLRMSIRDDLAFKIPALLQIDKWHHVCQSWNGVHGEWIVFLDGAKIGSGQLHKYKGTYVPGGGEVVVGQEPTNFHKGVDDGIEGEVFGFNLVDEAVKDDVIIKRKNIPSPPPPSPTMYVPPFKTLPPMRKSYQEIKAYIKSLPSEPIPYRVRNGGKPVTGHPKPGYKTKPHKHPSRPMRNKQRPRYKPVKAVIYERDDRQLRLNDAELTKKLGKLPNDEVRPHANQIYNESYSMHSYRTGKKPNEVSNYEIYEVQDEGKDAVRKPRQNFDIFTARRESNLYVMASKKRQQKKPTYHFETNRKKETPQRRNLVVDRTPKSLNPNTPLEFIPVWEVIDEETPYFRRKREVTEGDLTSNFRPMPKIPDGFINLFADPSQFFPNRTTEKQNEVFDGTSGDQIRRNMVVSVKELQRKPGITAGTELVKRSYEECTGDRGSPVRDKDRFVVSWAETPVRIYGGAVVTTAVNVCGHF